MSMRLTAVFLSVLLFLPLLSALDSPLAVRPAAPDNPWEQQQSVMGCDGSRSVGAAFGHKDETPDPRELVVNIIKIFLSFLALIFLVLIIMAGFKWMTAAGNPEQVKEAKHQLRSAIIGIIIIMFSYAITYFVTVDALEELEELNR